MSVNMITTLDFPSPLPVVRRGDHWVARAREVELRLSNLTKVFWPEAGYTKGDLLTYYFNVATTMLPYVVERPLTLKRMPDGIAGPYFYEKDAPAYTPNWVPTLHVEALTEERTIRFVTICDVASLLWVANLGCIEIHPHHTKGTGQACPTYAVFDLDPFAPAGLDETKYVASLVKVSLDSLGLRSFPKSSGRSGIQVYVPLDGHSTYEQVRSFVVRVSGLVNTAEPDATTVEWQVAQRVGKVFLDANLNRAGASLAAAYSVRADWHAPVSMPFAWEELDDLDPSSFTIATVPDEIARRPDPFAEVAGSGQSLTEALGGLGLS